MILNAVHWWFQDECSFVSLRDVERVLEVMAWFYEHGDELYDRMDDREEKTRQAGIHEYDEEEYNIEEEDELPFQVHLTVSKTGLMSACLSTLQ